MMNANKGTVFSPGKFPENNTQLCLDQQIHCQEMTHYNYNIVYAIKTLIKLLSVAICYMSHFTWLL